MVLVEFFCGERTVTGRSLLWVEFLLDTVTLTCLLAMRPMSAEYAPVYRGNINRIYYAQYWEVYFAK